MDQKLRTVDAETLADQKHTSISLFSGCGGMDLGFLKAGWDIRVMVEWDKGCCATLRANFTREGWMERYAKWKDENKNNKKELAKHKTFKSFVVPDMYNHFSKRNPVILQRDITTLPTKEILEAADLEIGECGVVTGGFPCQGFSTAGKRDVNDPRNKLYLECVRVLKETLPKTFAFENVPGLVYMQKGKIIDMICRDFADIGYIVTWDILNAADYGVPQNRRRVIFMGRRIDAMVLPLQGNMQLHMGVPPGRYTHPKWYEKKYKIYSSSQEKIDQYGA